MNNIFELLKGIGTETKEALERFMGDEAMYLKYVRDFPEEPSMGQLMKAVEEEDYKQAEASVHAMKGIVVNLGFLPLADATVDMLEELRDHNIDDALEAYEDVKTQYKRYCDVIIGWREAE